MTKYGVRGFLLALVPAITLTAFTLSSIGPAYAQVPEPPAAPAPMQAPLKDPGMIVVSSYIAACHPIVQRDKHGKVVAEEVNDDCARPDPVSRETFNANTPMVTHAQFLKRWPNSGESGYKAILQANSDLCGDAAVYVGQLNTIDEMLQQAVLTYNDLLTIFNNLPDEVRRNTRFMQISQAVQAGFLCVLSAGFYCIAAIAGAVGNSLAAQASMHVTLANIKVTIATILVTKLDIHAIEIDLRLQGMWLKYALPVCEQLGLGTTSGLPAIGPVPDVTQALVNLRKD